MAFTVWHLLCSNLAFVKDIALVQFVGLVTGIGTMTTVVVVVVVVVVEAAGMGTGMTDMMTGSVAMVTVAMMIAATIGMMITDTRPRFQGPHPAAY